MPTAMLIGVRKDKLRRSVLTLIFSLPVVLAAFSCRRQATETPASQPSAAEDASEFSLFDPKADVPELHDFRHDGANDIRDILAVGDGFLAATGRGIVRYRFADGEPKLLAEYAAKDGLPSDNCFLLRPDAEGGVWASGEGGVSFLAKGSAKWVAFTEKNGLAPGSVANMAIAPAGDRIWVASSGGLATASVSGRAWKSYPIRHPIEILIHPDGSKVWCRRLVRSPCVCGRCILTSQFDVKTASWLDVPGTGNCSHVAPAPRYFCRKTNRLWFSGGCAPPLVYDPSKSKIKTWPAEPRWERIENGNVVVYSDWFGQMMPFADSSGKMWFATNAGLWEYDPAKDHWQIHRLVDDPGCGQPLLVRRQNGKTIYWACEGILAAYDVASAKWTRLWEREDHSFGEAHHELMLSPDEKYLWWVRPAGVFVGNLETKESVLLTDKAEPGLSRVSLVKFLPSEKTALIATPRGVICSGYDGKIGRVLKRSTCPITHEVRRFVFAPDGSEVWCLVEDAFGLGQPAAVLYPKSRKWEEVPDPRTGRNFRDVMFSRDGRTTWLAIAIGGDEDVTLGVLERTKDNRQWVPIRAKIPKYYGSIERFWLTSKGDELWLDTGSSGLLRVNLTNGEVSQYVKNEYNRYKVKKHFTLIEDYVSDLVFTPDGKYAVCSASGGGNSGITLIDMRSGESENYPTKVDVEALRITLDQKTVICKPHSLHASKAFDIERRAWTKPSKHEDWVGAPGPGEYIDEEDVALSLWAAVDRIGGDLLHTLEVSPQDRIICSVRHPKAGGIFAFDPKRKSLVKLVDLGSAEVSLMKAGPTGLVWAAIPGGVVAVDPKTSRVQRYD